MSSPGKAVAPIATMATPPSRPSAFCQGRARPTIAVLPSCSVCVTSRVAAGWAAACFAPSAARAAKTPSSRPSPLRSSIVPAESASAAPRMPGASAEARSRNCRAVASPAVAPICASSASPRCWRSRIARAVSVALPSAVCAAWASSLRRSLTPIAASAANPARATAARVAISPYRRKTSAGPAKLDEAKNHGDRVPGHQGSFTPLIRH